MKDFKRGYVEAICNAIHMSQIDDGELSMAYALNADLMAQVYKGKGWSWHELYDAGVPEQDLVVLEHHQKAFGLGPRPIAPPADYNL